MNKDKELLKAEIVFLSIIVILFTTLAFVVSIANFQEWIKITLIVVDLIFVLIACFYGIKIEQIAGYYKCSKCSHEYTPTYKQMLFAPHIFWTRYMKCPECKEKSWSKKYYEKDEV